MLNNIGKILLIQVLIELAKVQNDITDQPINDTLENLHTTFSVALFKRWKFPLSFIEVVEYQHTQGQLEKCTHDSKIISYVSLTASNMNMYLHKAEKDAEVLETFGNVTWHYSRSGRHNKTRKH